VPARLARRARENASSPTAKASAIHAAGAYAPASLAPDNTHATRARFSANEVVDGGAVRMPAGPAHQEWATTSSGKGSTASP
jgi:hypothetical protein